MRITTHPGEYLKLEIMGPRNISNAYLASKLGVSTAAISRLVNCKSNLSLDMAYKLSNEFKTSVEFWANMQLNHSLSKNGNKL